MVSAVGGRGLGWLLSQDWPEAPGCSRSRGSSEIYCHPATTRDATLQRLMPEYQHEAELAALLASYT